MNALVFNTCLLLGWLMVLVGACMACLWAGLVAGGALLLAMTLYWARLAGVYSAKPRSET
ncbi:hypothetical protein SAMN04487785_102397 [Dyella jiangningensis]|uniref:hypothetical protein n=1 Tax=Dyella sp. AtDHG13 TaxID=1938897 RepID=UPI0008894418|nr:hypothetical protein [Dyella sp. AtDHG13]PXV60669.1 hypothetical protein BDW41_102396 [Dyella sp. AtDHG13]SDJ54465.1 hypothetical protein SAMN04487785_102397 [Dyella jiangningensis]